MAMSTAINDTLQKLQVSSTFQDPRCKGLVIVWKMGSATLQLCRTNVPREARLIDAKHHSTYKTPEGATKGVARWFNLLAAVYGEDA